MNCFGIQILVVVVFVTVEQFPTAADEPDFEAALRIVNEAKNQSGNVNYTEFCETTGRGASKLGCQIKAMNDVGLLVCLKPVDCKAKLESELNGLKSIRDAKLKVLDYHNEIIDELKCGTRGSTDVDCYGFLEKWIQKEVGEIKSLRKSISGNKTIDPLTDWVIGYQVHKSACVKTNNDLKAIRMFMEPSSPSQRDDGYNRICDLQGFFIKTGGFVISDPDGILMNTTANHTCRDEQDFPTTKKVIDALKQMSDKLDKVCNGGAPAALPAKIHLTIFTMLFLLFLNGM